MAAAPSSPRGLRSAGLLVVLLLGSMTVSYYGAGALREPSGGKAPTPQVIGDSAAAGIPGGRHLVAYVLISSECGFCTEKRSKEAIRSIRQVLRTAYDSAYARVTVVGVVMDDSLEAGTQYLKELSSSGRPFDQVSMGGIWLNEQVVNLVWRQAVSDPMIPQVIIVERYVDADNWPRALDVGKRDSVVTLVTGRTDLLTWVAAGGPLAFRP